MKLIASIIATTCISGFNPQQFFGQNYGDAMKHMQKDAVVIEKVATQFHCDPVLVKSIVFPEFLRNTVLSGLLEEKTLEAMYIDMGSKAVDFSIGEFQIKPSFAEHMEELSTQNKVLKKLFPDLAITSQSKKGRFIRLQRLTDLKWQTQYVCCFIKYCLAKYKLEDRAIAEQLKYLSLAYNAGIKPTIGAIEERFGQRYFPYGKNFPEQQAAYWEISLDYFLKSKSKE